MAGCLMIVDGGVYGDGEKRKTKIGRRTVHGKWGDPDVPQFGWEIVATEEEEAICGMCEYMHIEFSHAMRHPKFTVLKGQPVKGIIAGRYCGPCMASDGEKASIAAKRIEMRK